MKHLVIALSIAVCACTGQPGDENKHQIPFGNADNELRGRKLAALQPYFRAYCQASSNEHARLKQIVATMFLMTCDRDYPANDSNVCISPTNRVWLLCNYEGDQPVQKHH